MGVAQQIIGQAFDSALSEELPGWLLALAEEEMSTACACWSKVKAVTFEDFAVAGATEDIELFLLPQRGILHGIAIEHTEEFKGGTISTYELSVGLASDFERYLAKFDVFQAPGSDIFAVTFVMPPELIELSSATSIRIKAWSGGANLDQAAQGSANIYAFSARLPS